MTESELPFEIQMLLIVLQLFALGVFLYLIWPNIKSEEWRKKFIENRTARSILIVFVLILLFVTGLGSFFDYFFPVERLK
ncbi:MULTISPECIES: hypothetical protein [Thiomicrorhabdus]|uniref:DUF1146 domain-containing protein n=1 Tax=Thiomicrorhabdus heinhorstiae TaxID=2748010 RepID=A0ABS0BV05_9GAMM|nr:MULTISPECIES: hypothetical protein [Thiomicrorhabdus]MBF6056804.1 hypothetical protein [Thiomicrorhabdus heinhorstiae]